MKIPMMIAVCAMGAGCMQAQAPACPPPVTRIEMARGTFSSQPGVTFQLKHFRAALVPMGKTDPACYQKMTVVSTAEIFVPTETLTNLFAEKLKSANSKITDFKVTNTPAGSMLSGKIQKVIPVHFSVEGPVTTDGVELRLDAKSIKADGIPIKKLLDLAGAELNSVVPLKDLPGVRVEENSMFFAPEQVSHLKGHIASVTTSADGLTLRYTPARERHRSAKAAAVPAR